MILGHGATVLHGDDWTTFGVSVLVAIAVLISVGFVLYRRRSRR